MKTQTLSTTYKLKPLIYCIALVVALLAVGPVHSQSTATDQGITIKGTVKTEEGPLLGATVSLKGTEIGTTTDRNGEFTFPKALKPNDVLVISYLSYNSKEIKITNETTELDVTLTDDLIELLGAPSVNKPYKSKRKN